MTVNKSRGPQQELDRNGPYEWGYRCLPVNAVASGQKPLLTGVFGSPSNYWLLPSFFLPHVHRD